MKKIKIHRNCGGTIEGKKCLKCGKVWSRMKDLFAWDIIEKQVGFGEEAYRKRIREGKDIP